MAAGLCCRLPPLARSHTPSHQGRQRQHLYRFAAWRSVSLKPVFGSHREYENTTQCMLHATPHPFAGGIHVDSELLRLSQVVSSSCAFSRRLVFGELSQILSRCIPPQPFRTETLNLFISGAQNDSRRAEQVKPRLVPPRVHRILCSQSRDMASSHVVILSLPNAQAECRATLKAAPPRSLMEVLGERRLRRWTAAHTGAFDGGGDGECCTVESTIATRTLKCLVTTVF